MVVRGLYGPTDSEGTSEDQRRDPDRKGHMTGDRKRVYGTKFNMIFARGEGAGSRLILSVDHVASDNEAKTAMSMLRRISDRLPNMACFIYDGALRGVHHNQVLTEMGMSAISPPHAASGAKGSGEERKEKRIFVETVTVKGGQMETCEVWAEGGAAAIGQIDVGGSKFFVPLSQIKAYRISNKNGTWRWYADYELPASAGGGRFSLAHYNTSEDKLRNFNRTENLRLFPKGSPQYEELYGRRSDAESSNRNLKDTLWIDRAHCLGARRQLVMLHGYQRAVNAKAIWLHRNSQSKSSQAA